MMGTNIAFQDNIADMPIYDDAFSQSEIAALTSGFAETCPIPSSAHPDVGAALADRACEKIDTPGQILNTGNMGDDASCLNLAVSNEIKLEPLADNGGPTPTQAIPMDNKAVNASDPA